MSVSNIADVICNYIDNAIDLPFTIYTDLIVDSDVDGACIRHDPTPAAEKRFLDGSRLVSWNLTFYIRCKDASCARNYANKIIDILDGSRIIEPTTGIVINCEGVTLAQFISVDDKNFTMYSASIRAQYIENGD